MLSDVTFANKYNSQEKSASLHDRTSAVIGALSLTTTRLQSTKQTVCLIITTNKMFVVTKLLCFSQLHAAQLMTQCQQAQLQYSTVTEKMSLLCLARTLTDMNRL